MAGAVWSLALAAAGAPLVAQDDGFDEVARIRADVRWLADPARAGRPTGGDPEAARVAWLVAAMEALELRRGWVTGAGGEGRHRQTLAVPDPATRRATEDSLLVVRSEGRVRLRRDAGRGWLALPFSPGGEVRGPLVLAGHGVVGGGHDDLAGLDLDGAVVLVLRGHPELQPGSAPAVETAAGASPGTPDAPTEQPRPATGPIDPAAVAAAGRFTAKLAALKAAGASAVLLAPRFTEEDEGDLEADVRHAVGEAGLPAILLTRGSAARLLGRTREDLTAVTARLDAGERALHGPVADVDVLLELEMPPPAPPLQAANVVGIVPGAGKKAHEWIAVVAHHDHLGRDADGALLPGADDNASGVAALLALAARVAGAPPPPRTIVFVLTAAEELGSAGARTLLADPPLPGRPAAVLELNMVGRAASQGLAIVALDDRLRATTRATLDRGATGLDVEVRGRSAGRGDHAVFAAATVPTMLLTSGLHADYHRPTDTADRVEPEAILAVVRLVERLLFDIASLPPGGL